MPPILHGVTREGRWPFSATGSGSLPASGGYGLSAEAQLHRYALIRNIQGGWRRTRTRAGDREETSSQLNKRPLRFGIVHDFQLKTVSKTAYVYVLSRFPQRQ